MTFLQSEPCTNVMKSQTINTQTLFTFGYNVFCFALAIYPYSLIWGLFAPIRFGSITFQILIPSLMLIFSAFLQIDKIIKELGAPIISLFFLGFSIILLKIIFGLKDIGSLQNMRILCTLPLFWSLYKVYGDNEARCQNIRRIIVWNCVFTAIFGIIHFLFFPEIILRTVEFEPGETWIIPSLQENYRETAYLGNPNHYSNFLISGIMGLFFFKKTLYTLLISLLLFCGVVLSVSRWPIYVSMILVTVLIFNILFRKSISIFHKLIFITICVILFIVFYSKISIVTNAFQYSLERKLTSSRIDKYKVGISELFIDVSHFILGISSSNTFSDEEVKFSDNSLIEICQNFGVPFGILWILIIYKKICPIGLLNSHKRVAIYLWGTLIITNGIYWDIWLLYTLGILVTSKKY